MQHNMEDEVLDTVDQMQNNMEDKVLDRVNQVQHNMEEEVLDRVNQVQHNMEDKVLGRVNQVQHNTEDEVLDSVNQVQHNMKEEVLDSVNQVQHNMNDEVLDTVNQVQHNMEDEVLDTVNQVQHNIEDEMSRGEVWTEVEVAKTVDQFRREQLDSRGLSFATIAGFGPNGALPHYTPAITTNRQIYTNSTLVLDSGGQYLDGTTDVTRTLHFGSPNQFERETYTRVLQGSIQLSALVFPQGVLMSDVDVLARAPLWQVGLDYRHGTGHGIGAFLDVHECKWGLPRCARV
uniref:Peptidase M24 domain-containing protein n=1 Tax=Timema genevievae TaxID=629358 RepID=A0A7R9PTB6_TIMGE|nr:unnamed protein product [Timema genevievae]